MPVAASEMMLGRTSYLSLLQAQAAQSIAAGYLRAMARWFQSQKNS